MRSVTTSSEASAVERVNQGDGGCSPLNHCLTATLNARRLSINVAASLRKSSRPTADGARIDVSHEALIRCLAAAAAVAR
jgi:hypothetical protein